MKLCDKGGDILIDINLIDNIFKDGSVIVKTSTLKENGLRDKDIQALINSNTLERVKHGYYRKKEIDLSENQLIEQFFSDGVITMDSALYYYIYSDRTPIEWHIAFSKDTSKSRFSGFYPPVKPYYLSPESLTFGVTNADYIDAKMKIFDRDRIICEVLLYENKLEREIYNKAIQGYIADSKKNIAKLLEYAALRRVTKKVKDKIEVWL